jgi:hypothetical protein
VGRPVVVTRIGVGEVLAALLRYRIVSAVLVCAVGLHLLLTGFGYPAYACPFRVLTGCPCLGCGVSRGVASLLRGDWAGMVSAHPFSPYFLVLGLVLLASLFLGEKARQRLASGVASLERRTHVNTVVLAGFVVYGVARLCGHLLAG